MVHLCSCSLSTLNSSYRLCHTRGKAMMFNVNSLITPPLFPISILVCPNLSKFSLSIPFLHNFKSTISAIALLPSTQKGLFWESNFRLPSQTAKRMCISVRRTMVPANTIKRRQHPPLVASREAVKRYSFLFFAVIWLIAPTISSASEALPYRVSEVVQQYQEQHDKRNLQEGFFQRQKAKTLGRSSKRGNSSSSYDEEEECESSSSSRSSKSGKKTSSSSKKNSSSSSSSKKFTPSSSTKKSGKKQCSDGSRAPSETPVTSAPTKSPSAAPTIPLCSVDSQDPNACLVNGQKCEQSLECCSCCCNTNGGVCASADSGATCLADGVVTTLDFLPLDDFQEAPTRPSAAESSQSLIEPQNQVETSINEEGVVYATIGDLGSQSNEMPEEITNAPSIGLGSDAPSLLPSQRHLEESDAPSIFPSQKVSESNQKESERFLSFQSFGSSTATGNAGAQTSTISTDLDGYSILLRPNSGTNNDSEGGNEAPHVTVSTRFYLLFSLESLFYPPGQMDKMQLEEEVNVFLKRFLHEEQRSGFKRVELDTDPSERNREILSHIENIDTVLELASVSSTEVEEIVAIDVLFVATGIFTEDSDTSTSVQVLDHLLSSAFRGHHFDEFHDRLVSTLPSNNIFSAAHSLRFSSRIEDSESDGGSLLNNDKFERFNMTIFSLEFRLPAGHRVPSPLDVLELSELTRAYLSGFVKGHLFGEDISSAAVKLETSIPKILYVSSEVVRVDFGCSIVLHDPSITDIPPIGMLDIARSRAFSRSHILGYTYMVQALDSSNIFSQTIDINGRQTFLEDDDFVELDTRIVTNYQEGRSFSAAAVTCLVLFAVLLLIGASGVLVSRKRIHLEELGQSCQDGLSWISRRRPGDTMQSIDMASTHASDMSDSSSKDYMSESGDTIDADTVAAVAPYDIEHYQVETDGASNDPRHHVKRTDLERWKANLLGYVDTYG